jgi:hypothetical protein
MEHWVIVGLGLLLVLLFLFKTQSFASVLSPAPGPVPSNKWTQTMIIPAGGNCEAGWTKIGNVTCAK